QKDSDSTVVLTPELTKRLGITTTPAQAITFTPGAEGFGVVLSHDPIAQVAADLDTATAAARQSHAALERMQHLAGGPGALGADALESATKQTAADQAALTLARRKLTATLGLQFPGRGAETGGVLAALANGTFKLARVTFPPGSLTGATPHGLRLFSAESDAAQAAWTASTIWDAPQDPNIPGRSVFALLRRADIPEGARLQALPVSESGVPGVLIPAAAVVVSNGRYWCYLRRSANSFERTPIAIDRPLAQGYFVAADRVAPGDEIVTAAAGLLLARQTTRADSASDSD
ncbi:MAG: hypothetical protein ACREU6_02470, partial [Steroidobacteraceae bacterium]